MLPAGFGGSCLHCCEEPVHHESHGRPTSHCTRQHGLLPAHFIMHAFLKGSSGIKVTPKPSGRSGASWERLFSEGGSSSTGSQRSSSAAAKALPGKAPSTAVAAPPSSKTAEKKSKKRPLEQLYLDFGQRTFGRTVECSQCGFTYCEGEPSDEAAHM